MSARTEHRPRFLPALPSLFYRYMGFYVTLLVFPLLLMGVLINGSYFRAYLDETGAVWNSRLQQMRIVVETNFSQLRRIAFQLSSNEYVQRAQYDPNPFVGRKIMTELRKFNTTNDFIREIVVILRDYPIWYSSSTSYTARTFLESFYRFDGLGPVEFGEWLDSLLVPTIRPEQPASTAAGDLRDYLLYVFPLPVSYFGEPFGFIVFVIESDQVASILLSDEDAGADNLTVTDADGRVLLTLGDAPSPAESGALRGDPTTDLLTVRVTSPVDGWSYVSYVPRRVMEGRFGEIRSLFLSLVLFITIVGGALIFVFMRLSWGVISKVSRQIREVLGSAGGDGRPASGPRPHQRVSGPGNELDIIRSSFQSVIREISFLTERVTMEHGAIKEFVVFNLLQGRFRDAADVNRYADESGVRIESQAYSAAIALVDRDPGIEALEAILSLTESTGQPALGVYGRMSAQRNRLVYVVGHPADGAETAVLHFRSRAPMILAQHGVSVSVGLGSARPSLAELPASYIEASAALDYRLIVGGGGVIEFAGMSPAGDAQTREFRESFDRLCDAVCDAVRGGERDALDRAVRSVEEQLVAAHVPLTHAKVHVAAVFRALAATVQSLVLGDDSVGELQDVFMVARFESTADLMAYVKVVLGEAFDAVARSSRVSGELRAIQEYMAENLSDARFSVQTVAERFGMSHSALTALFKKECAVTPRSFINDLRMRKAKMLLKTTRMQLKEIVRAIGYMDDSNFIRKFREAEHITPGDYHRMFFDEYVTRR